MSVLAGWESTAARATLPVGRLRLTQVPPPRRDVRREARPSGQVERSKPRHRPRSSLRSELRVALLPAPPPEARPRHRPRPWTRGRPVRRPAGLAVAPPARPEVTACASPYARRRLVALLVLAVATAAVVAGLLALRAVATDDGVPRRTTVVEVRGGETLWDVAGRVAPDSAPQAVVERIRELNGMHGSTVHPGQPLLVPDGR